MELHILLPSWLSAQTWTLKSYKDLQKPRLGVGGGNSRAFSKLPDIFVLSPKNPIFKIATKTPENTAFFKKQKTKTWLLSNLVFDQK